METYKSIFPKMLKNSVFETDDLSTAHVSILDCNDSILKSIMDNTLIIPAVSNYPLHLQ